MKFTGKTILITGGTGSLGEELLRRITGAKEIRVLSRSEKGQIPLKAKYPLVKFILGDVSDLEAVKDSVRGCDIVIHAAAFKFLDLAEKQARQCVITNVIGSLNVISAVKEVGGVDMCVGISTDKVCYARNVYGCTKHIMEKLFREANENSDTKFFCVRYGNVIGTTGSVTTIWERQKKEGLPITITDRRMTRFFFTLSEAVNLIVYAMDNAKGGEIFVKKMNSVRIEDMAKEVSDNIVEIGLRQGEKLHETLIADYEGLSYTSDNPTNTGGIVTL